ncbi:MAG TPA: hypothetical protein VIR77_05305 [Pontiella sp.]
MKAYYRLKTVLCIAAGLSIGIAGYAAEEGEVKVTIEKLTVEDSVYTPFYEVETGLDHAPGSAQRWIKLGVYFTTEGGWIDEIDIRQMVVFKPEEDSRVYMSETVKYINLEPGDHYAYVYLHPSYVRRYDIDDHDVDSAAYISVNGEVAAFKETSRKTEKNWSADETRSYKNYLLNHAETPFWFINYDYKEIIKRENRPTE